MRKFSRFSVRQIWRKLAYILEQLATRVDEEKVDEYSAQLIDLLPEIGDLFDRIDCLCKVGFIMDGLRRYHNARSSSFEASRLALRSFVDEYFTQLQCDLQPVAITSGEFSRVSNYWNADPSAISWNVVNVFRIQNRIESRAFLRLDNRKVLEPRLIVHEPFSSIVDSCGRFSGMPVERIIGFQSFATVFALSMHVMGCTEQAFISRIWWVRFVLSRGLTLGFTVPCYFAAI
uniref:AlNc14C344G10831 protein n=1 Tax=Albugo laibachii Nc14 TaxID=890382 RepID=F0WX73_9STRA|nr:AlNc14C344G10831 [Albugo laibachii Nc14]|eukprot:CCA26065.1 AlNc14C344G10831 [Albugo laibachii Nc14]